ncbi:MAG TPA: hypothetical protein VMZ53_08405 [Kofleriaceae bacterium]|nr:hypothetical protein [Kofleriaceae bacterium]
MSHDILDWIAREVGARAARRRERIQSLWGGVGELFRIELEDGPIDTAIVKWAQPPVGVDDVSTRRKKMSFAVEVAFYRSFARRCDDSCRVANLLAARISEEDAVLVLEDLDAAGYPRRTDEADDGQLDAALAWLASFHARFVGERPGQLWPTGTYWHLDTRLDELAVIEDRALREAAPAIAYKLSSARFQTIVHGDPKEANFCFGPAGIAAVDFQYTGRACGMTDLAYLLYGRADEPADGIDHVRIATYFAHLRARLPATVDGDALEAEWRALYAYARLDFCRFLAGWRPAMWERDTRGRRFVQHNL